MNDSVVIAGGGPAGLMLACELQLAGVPAVVLEGRPVRERSSGGMLLHARSVDALRRRGLADRFRDATTPVWPRTHFAFLWLDLSELGETDYDLIVPQWRTEELLEQRAVELGVRVLPGHRLTGLRQDADGVAVRVRSAAGEQVLRCAYLVGCDGPHSTVAELGGFAFRTLAPSYYGVIADVAVSGDAQEHFRAGVHPDGQFGVLPMNPRDPSEVRLMTVEFDREPPAADVPVTAEEMRAAIRRITGADADFAEPRWMTRYGSPTRLATSYRKGRLLLAGDAAHPHPPSSGNGLNTALHDSVNLGWKLAATIHGWAPPGLLDTYHDERHPVGRRACMRALAQVPLQHPPERAEPLRELFAELIEFPEVNRHLVQAVTRVRYPIAYPGLPAKASSLLGATLPDVTLRTAGGEVEAAGLLAGGRGLLLSLGVDEAPDLTGWADRLDVVRADEAEDLDARWLLVRPDGHIAWVDTGEGDREGLRAAVTTWFGPARKPRTARRV
ncbi:FAD-dependent monooxygenase [Streptomyces camelliae]|uniref:FAD-dependent monooxygenase n=1 Tax=Streptomyces camelliae TaxID=3004093 RepID=A0ABY7P0R3_9ACTN|nr:FAD-dependent monooxygenase [Streptomyces sp. HUAS 2-6]WBO62923.1 FAD-dependent monooxygenase [Streptomyces sp. HUAS 2-6]